MTVKNIIAIARPGYDIDKIEPDTPENIKKFSLISGINNFSLLKTKITEKVTLNNTESIDIPHGLSYTPIVWVFMKNGSGNMVPVYNDFSGTAMYVDGTKLHIINQDGATRDFYYYIFYDEI